MDNKKLPLSIELIFDNFTLHAFSFLCISSIFSKKNGTNFRELSFYYNLVLSEDFSKLNTDLNPFGKILHYNIKNFYHRSQKEIRRIIIFLYNSGLIDILKKEENNILDLNQLSIKTNEKGQKLIDNLESEYFIYILELSKKLKLSIKYSRAQEKEIIGV